MNPLLRFFSMWCFGLTLLVNASLFASAQYPNPVDDYINDFAQVISDKDKMELTETLIKLEKQTDIEMVVVTIKSMDDYEENQTNIDQFAKKLFNHWGVGKLPANDGVMLLVAIDDKKTRIQLGDGYKHQYDNSMKSIIEEIMVPEFRATHYDKGIIQGSHAIIAKITSPVSWMYFHRWHILLAVLGLISIFAGISVLQKGRFGWGWTFFTLGFGLIISVIVSILKPDRDGFGGGSSSNGGASGGW